MSRLRCSLLLFLIAAPGCSSPDETSAPAIVPVVEAAAPPPVRADAGADAAPPVRATTKAVVVDLGEVAPHDVVTLDVPPHALGFHIVVEGTLGAVGVERITSPSGEDVHAAYTPKSTTPAMTYRSWGNVAAVSVPQSDALSASEPQPGKWQITFGCGPFRDSSCTEKMRARASIQIGSSEGFVGGQLDLHVYVPIGLQIRKRTVDADDAEHDAAIAERLDIFFEGLSYSFGLDRGKVTFHKVDSSYKYMDDAHVDVGFAVSRGVAEEQALHVLFTNFLTEAWGIAPSVPGAALRTGTSMSGIIVALGDTASDGDGDVILHEAGHFFGLGHTTELAGGEDAFTDTPYCETVVSEGLSKTSECGDRSNVMFPTSWGYGPGHETSAGQKRVFRGSPIYRAYAEPVPRTLSLHPRVMRAAPSQHAPCGLGVRPLRSP